MRSEFAYTSPSSLGEALEILKDYGERACVIAGGTDLMIAIREGELRAELLVDISRIPELQFIAEEGNQICIGPLVTHGELASSGLIKKGHLSWEGLPIAWALSRSEIWGLSGETSSTPPPLPTPSLPWWSWGPRLYLKERGGRGISL